MRKKFLCLLRYYGAIIYIHRLRNEHGDFFFFEKKSYFLMAWFFYHRPVSSLSISCFSTIDVIYASHISLLNKCRCWFLAFSTDLSTFFFRYLSNTVRSFTYFFSFKNNFVKGIINRSWLKIVIPSGYIIRWWWIWIWRILVKVRCVCSILNSRHDRRFKGSCS